MRLSFRKWVKHTSVKHMYHLHSDKMALFFHLAQNHARFLTYDHDRRWLLTQSTARAKLLSHNLHIIEFSFSHINSALNSFVKQQNYTWTQDYLYSGPYIVDYGTVFPITPSWKNEIKNGSIHQIEQSHKKCDDSSIVYTWNGSSFLIGPAFTNYHGRYMMHLENFSGAWKTIMFDIDIRKFSLIQL